MELQILEVSQVNAYIKGLFDRDALLGDLLEEAEQYILGYTGRRVLPLALEGAVIETAAASFHLLGLEGASSHAEGGVNEVLAGIFDMKNMETFAEGCGRVGAIEEIALSLIHI